MRTGVMCLKGMRTGVVCLKGIICQYVNRNRNSFMEQLVAMLLKSYFTHLWWNTNNESKCNAVVLRMSITGPTTEPQ